MEDGLDIHLTQFQRLKTLFSVPLCVFISQAHNTSPLSHQNGAEYLSPSYNIRLRFARPAAEIFPVSSNRLSLGNHYLS